MTITQDKILARGLSAIAVAAAAVALAGCSLLNGVTGGGNGGAVEGEGTDTSAFAIQVGDCLNDASAGDQVETIPVVACTEPHDSEVYAEIILDDGSFPGDDAVTTEAEDGCFAAFEGYVGIAYESSKYEISYYYPTQQTWDELGDRVISCVLYVNGEQSTGSAKGTAQ